MADGFDRFDQDLRNSDGGNGGSFVIGLLAGTVLGAGLGMLFAPKAGSELRNDLSAQAGKFADQASEGYRRASESATEWVGKGRQAYDKARDAVAKGADEAEQYVRDTAAATASASSSGAGAFEPRVVRDEVRRS